LRLPADEIHPVPGCGYFPGNTFLEVDTMKRATCFVCETPLGDEDVAGDPELPQICGACERSPVTCEGCGLVLENEDFTVGMMAERQPFAMYICPACGYGETVLPPLEEVIV